MFQNLLQRANIDIDQIKTSLNQVTQQIVNKIEVTTNEFFKDEKEKPKFPWDEPPIHWKGKEEELKKKVLHLSTKATTFLSPTPLDFKFSFEDYLERAKNSMEIDQNLSKYVYLLIPKEISEVEFWRNYFFRVKIICETEAHEEIDHLLQRYYIPIQKKKVSRKIEYDYSSLEHDLKVYKENLTSVLQECINEFKKKKKFQENETLNQLYKRVTENKKDLALWLIEIQDSDILTRSVQVNEHISLVLKEFEEYKQMSQNQDKIENNEEKEKIKKDIKNEILKKTIQLEEKEIKIEENNLKENEEKKNEEIIETKLPWEEEDEDFVYSK